MHFQMPSSEPDAKITCGTKLIATRNSETETWWAGVEDSRLRDQGFKITGLSFGFGFRVQGPRSRVQGSRFRV